MTDKPDLKVVQLDVQDQRDVVGLLRTVADDIESGAHGTVGTVAIAVFGNKLEVYGAGPDSAPCSIAMTLHAGFLQFSQYLVQHGREDDNDEDNGPSGA